MNIVNNWVSSVQSFSRVQLFAIPWTTACQDSLSIPNSQPRVCSNLCEIDDAIQPSHPLSSPSAPTHNLFQHQGLSNESALLIRWPNYWSFSFSISPPSEYSGLIFRINWFGVPAVQGTQESSPTPQFKRINSLVLSFLYSPTLTSIHDYWKNHSLDSMDLCWQSNVCFLICCLGWS